MKYRCVGFPPVRAARSRAAGPPRDCNKTGRVSAASTITDRCPMKRRAVELALRACASLVAVFAAVASSPAARATALQANDDQTVTPIKHVIVIIGENRTFDHVFATYRPRAGQSVVNLLSEGIVKSDGSPGPNFAEARQFE